jgi:beta-barrel assembly-enhancing protease
MPIAPRHLFIALLAAGLTLTASAQEDVRLPDLGSSANALLTPKEADEYGASMVRQMRSLDMVLDDALLDSYINDLGYRLVAASEKPKDSFSFFIVKDPEINAFAAPGGYIGVNTGLIAITDNEGELAGVIAHEIGHINQKHLERAFEDSKKNMPMMALVLLGAIAAGAAGGGDAAPAVLAAGQGMIMQRQINFTRKDEAEADRVGIQTLSKAGYDPEGMASFFGRMADSVRAGAGGEGVPELLQTHPVTQERISEAKARARVLIDAKAQRPGNPTLDKAAWEKSTAPIRFVKDPTTILTRSASELDTYPLMRERSRVLAGDALHLATFYEQSFEHDTSFDTPANRYGYALALTRSARGAKAQDQLTPLLARYPANLVLQLAMADAKLDAGRRGEALAIYTELNARSPRNPAVTLAYAQALLTGTDKDSATKAAVLLKPMLDDAQEPDIYRTFARASERADDPIRAAEAYADASYLSGRPFDAMEQLERLLKRQDLDYYQRSRIQARISELTPLVLELRKRRVQTDDNPDGRSQQLQEKDKACTGRLCFGIEGR